MVRAFKLGDHVAWNSESGRVSGTIVRKLTSEVVVKGYTRHASRDDPQYMIKSDTTDHMAIHRGAALTLLPRRARKKPRTSKAGSARR